MTDQCRICGKPLDSKTRTAGGEGCFDCATKPTPNGVQVYGQIGVIQTAIPNEWAVLAQPYPYDNTADWTVTLLTYSGQNAERRAKEHANLLNAIVKAPVE